MWHVLRLFIMGVVCDVFSDCLFMVGYFLTYFQIICLQ